MGLMRLFDRAASGMMSLFLKMMLILILIVVIIATIAGIISNWEMVLGIFIGMLFSPIIYSTIDSTLNLGLPEIFFWGWPEVLEASTADEYNIKEVKSQNDEKLKNAKAEVNKVEQRYQNLKAAYADLKTKNKIGTMLLGEKKAKQYTSARLKQLMRMELGEPTWLTEMGEIKEKVDWHEFE